MEEYLKRILLKEINEIYYKNYQDTELEPLSLVSPYEIYTHNIRVSSELTDFHYMLMTEDLLGIMKGQNLEMKSRTSLDLVKRERTLSACIKNALPKTAIYEEVTNILKSLSPNACLVGGFNRDAILGVESKDVDFATDTPYAILKYTFEKNNFTVKEEGEAFLVMMVSKKDANNESEFYEIANFRKDSDESDGRHPDEVSVGTIKEDGLRRDFTINALFYNLKDERLIDPTGQGIEDIMSNTLRFIGKPEDRIREDYLRVWRAFRLAKTKGLTMDRKTEKALRTMFKVAYEKSNPARVLQEMIKL